MQNPAFKILLIFQNHSTIYFDTFGELYDIFNIAGGHLSDEIKPFL